MKQALTSLFKPLLVVFLIQLVLLQPIWSQDTVVIQSMQFSDITKRRDTIVFPDASQQFSKILMKMTLKCDPQTRQDQYDCGEWDYANYTYIYNHDGRLDSLIKTHPTFKVSGATPDSIAYVKDGLYNYWLEDQYTIRHLTTTSLNVATVGIGNTGFDGLLAGSQDKGRSQFIMTPAELTAAGLNAGPITGMRLDFSALGGMLNDLEIGLGHTTDTAFANSEFYSTSRVYRSHTNFTSTGVNDIQFTQPFTWDGTSSVVIELSFSNQSQRSDYTVQGSQLSYDAALYSSSKNGHLEFKGNPQYVSVDQSATVLGGSPRTIEAWARADAFNNGGIFQMGVNSTARDYSIRTTTTTDRWKVNVWGAGDFTVDLPGSKDTWHHYALVYNGSAVLMYYDGALVGQKAVSLSTGLRELRIGRWQGSYFVGGIDEFRVWDKALTPATIQDWMHREVDAAHPDYASLRLHHSYNETQGGIAHDGAPAGMYDGRLRNLPWWSQQPAGIQDLNRVPSTFRPNVSLEQGVYTSVIDTTQVMDSVLHTPVELVWYNNPANGVQIPENSPIHPTLATDTQYVYDASNPMEYRRKETGMLVSSQPSVADTTAYQKTKEWYSPETRIEIARYITPYGIGLTLGPDGFTWWYDVTDYRPYLTDTVDLSSGSQSELIDLKFLMIKGEPAREVKNITKIWAQTTNYRYRDIDNDVVMAKKKIPLHKDAKSFRVKARITGHGHNSDDGNYPHCCEWKDNEHSLYVNGSLAQNWHVWQTHDCALNPVIAQGGTWVGAREGWCPGDVVKENDIEITNMVQGDSVELDFSITPVPANNQGMGNGRYLTSMHLLQYGEAAHQVDAEIYNVINPTNKEYYSKMGVICENPRVILRNSGKQDLKRVTIKYRVTGGEILTYTWQGVLPFMQMVEVELPLSDEAFYTGSGDKYFEARVCNPNDGEDENPDNDVYTTAYNLPDMFPSKLVLTYRTNNHPQDNLLVIKDAAGNEVFRKENLDPNTNYNDTLAFPEGCYTLDMLDTGDDGLYYYFNNAQGSGLLRFMVLDDQNNIVGIKNFTNDFGRRILYPFSISKEIGDFPRMNATGNDWICLALGQEEGQTDYEQLRIYPNPSQGTINLELIGLNGDYDVQIWNTVGQPIKQMRVTSHGYHNQLVELNGVADGMYIIQVSNENETHTGRFMISNAR